MRAVVQRVHHAAVVIDGEETARIDGGLLIYLGVANDDEEGDAAYLAEKVRYLRIFPDENKPMNRDVVDAQGEALVVSAFATLADARKGRRPAFVAAAEPEKANELYERFCALLRVHGLETRTGRFREHMDIVSTNDGPICILLDSKRVF
jgi:D-tyrosyl-tRNA(Tyr) deacylase